MTKRASGESEDGALGRPTKQSSRKLTWDKVLTKELFRRYRLEGDEEARDELITMYLNLVKYLASRFRNRGEPIDDLVQVGTIGLIKAIDRFDIDRQVEFTTYATPTIVGELKRYFRDKGWAIKVPRRLQELSFKVNQSMDVLTQRLQRSPTIAGDRRVPRGDPRRGPRGDGDLRGVQLRLAGK